MTNTNEVKTCRCCHVALEDYEASQGKCLSCHLEGNPEPEEEE